MFISLPKLYHYIIVLTFYFMLWVAWDTYYLKLLTQLRKTSQSTNVFPYVLHNVYKCRIINLKARGSIRILSAANANLFVEWKCLWSTYSFSTWPMFRIYILTYYWKRDFVVDCILSDSVFPSTWITLDMNLTCLFLLHVTLTWFTCNT